MAAPASEYRGDLSNHLPMALHALHSLGADEERLRAFAVNYVKRFEGAPATPTGQVLTRWQDHRGDFSRFADLRASFALAIAQQGALVTLQQALPDLWPGVAAAAFHGLIRTAHAWEMSHDGELANGLAYWASRWQRVRAMPSTDPLDFATWSAQLSGHGAAPHPAGRLITERIAQIQDSPAFRQLSSQLLVTPHTLRQLAWFAAHHFAQTGDFTVLHMVTGCRAVRVLLTAVPGSEPWALACLVPAFTAAFLSSGIGRTAPLSSIEGEAPEWSDVVNAALRSDDDHLAKIVHACSDEAAAHANPAYLQAACRAVSVRGE